MSKIQFNTKELANFRTIMSKYYNARHELNDFCNKKADAIRGYRSIIATDESDLADIEAGKYHGMRTIEAIKADIEAMQKKVEDAQAEYSLAVEECNKRCMDAVKLVRNNEAIFRAYNEYISAFCSDESTEKYAEVIADFLRDNGASDATASNCVMFTRGVGGKKNSAKASFDTGKLVGAEKVKKFTELWLGFICDYLCEVGAISKYKYSYTPESVRKKLDKKTK